MIEPPVNNIKLSQTAKDQLLKLKRLTKIEQWNILCRWAFCRSLAETAPPSLVPIPADSIWWRYCRCVDSRAQTAMPSRWTRYDTRNLVPAISAAFTSWDRLSSWRSKYSAHRTFSWFRDIEW